MPGMARATPSAASARRGARPGAWALARVGVAGLACLCLSAAGCSSTPSRPSVSAPEVPPRDAGLRARLSKGDAARREGRLDEALADYEQALAADPAHLPSHMRLVETLLSTGRRSVARDRYRARAAAPGATQAERVMAARLDTDGSPAAVRTVYVAAAKAAPNDPWWRLALAEVDLGAADRFIHAYDDARQSGDRPRAAETLDLARRALSRANSAVENATKRDPSLPETHLYRGLVRALEGDLLAGASGREAAFRSAMEAFERAVAADPGMLDAWANLGDAAQRAGDAEIALSAYLSAIRLAPNDPDLREGAGLVLFGLERHVDAAAQYTEAARLRPRDAAPLLNAGDGWAAADRFEEALAAYDEALVRDPSAVEAHAKRGAVLERMGRLGEAREAYAVYVERDGADAAAARRRIERLLTPDEARPR